MNERPHPSLAARRAMHWTRRPFRVSAGYGPEPVSGGEGTLDVKLNNHQPRSVQTFTKRVPATPDQVARAMEHLRNYVRENGLKNSQVREKIVEGAMKFPGHFTVEDLVRDLREIGVKNVHTATIYRAMPLLIDAGLIEPALVADGDGQLYESVFEQQHHDHLVCVKCRRVVEFYSEALEAIQREISDRYGYSLQDHILELRGVCAKCRKLPKHTDGSTAG